MSTQEPLSQVEAPIGDPVAGEQSNIIEDNFRKIILGVVAFLVVFALILWWKSASKGDTEESWGRFQKATTAEEFESIADDFPDTPVATWSTLLCGEVQLQEAGSLVFSDRTAADDLIAAAETKFDSLIEAGLSDEYKEVTGRAILGKARALEMTGNDIEGAIAQYEIMQAEYKDLGYDALVKERIEALNSASSKQFYAWFKDQEPKPSDQASPNDGNPFGNLPPNHPSMQPITLPQIPPEMFPNDWSELTIDEPTFEPPTSIDDDSKSTENDTTEPPKTDATEPPKTEPDPAK